MKKYFLTCIIILFVFHSFARGQDFIGKTVEEVKSLMKESMEEFSFIREVNTEKYHYLKFENSDKTKTMLFILSDEGICKYTRLMCDYGLLKNMVDSLNNNYQYQKDQTWIEYRPDEEYDYLIELEKRDWFFTIKTSRNKN